MRKRSGIPVTMGNSTNQLQLQLDGMLPEGNTIWSSLMS